MRSLKLSVVVPLLNEAENIRELHRQIAAAAALLGLSYEVIYVDDGSTDGSMDVLISLQNAHPEVVVVQLRRNFGQTAALSAGFRHVRGETVVTLDADLQNDPADIPRLLEKMEEGYDIVSGWRVQRKDAFLTRILPSRIANRLISLFTGVHLHDYGCSLKAFRRDVVEHLRLYGEMHRFIPAVASWIGVSVAEIPVNHRPRKHGSSKYGLSRTFRVILDLLTVKFLLSYSTRPIQIFGLIGLWTGGAGFALSSYLAYMRLIEFEPIGGRPLLLLAILLMFIGIQFVTMGLLGEMLSRVYHESVDKPTYVVKRLLRTPDDPEAHE